MVKAMDATQHTFPLLNGKQATLSHFLSLDPTLTPHPQPATIAAPNKFGIGISTSASVGAGTWRVGAFQPPMPGL